MSTKFRYFPSDKAKKEWGLYVCDVGWQHNAPKAEYPVKSHPNGYYYTWETGRRLSEYQLGFIFSGEGVVEFEVDKPTPLPCGTLFLLSPGQWHRCRPNARMGWGTLWIGFNGRLARSAMQSLFHSDSRVTRPIVRADEFKQAAMGLVNRLLKSGDSKPFSAAGDLLNLLGRIAEGDFDGNDSKTTSSTIRMTQAEIARRFTETIDFPELAKSVGMSYDAFRHNFVRETGLSPLQFLLSIRLHTAKNLIANTSLPISKIALQTGFSSAAYFTRFFKSETGMSPIEFRKAEHETFIA